MFLVDPYPSYVLGLNSPKHVAQSTQFSLKTAFLHSNTDLIEQNLKSRPDGLGKKPRIASIKDVQGKFRLASMSSTRASLARVLFYPIKRLASLGKHVRGYLKSLTFLSLPNTYLTLDFFLLKGVRGMLWGT